MQLDVDGFAVLRTIATNRVVFATIGADATKAARALVLKQMAHKGTGLHGVRGIRAALGEEVFTLIVDGMTNAQVKSLAARLDKHGAAANGAPGMARLHVLALAAGTAEPRQQPATPKPPRARKTAPPPPRVHFESAGVVRQKE